jgi:hypothetical protein
MNSIVLQFVGAADLGGEFIQWFDHGPFAHVDSVLPDGTLLGARSDVWAGVPAGVQIRPADYMSFKNPVRAVLDAPDQIVKAYYDFLFDQVGKPYDMTGIVGFAVNRDWRNPAAWFCSELAAAGLEISGFLQYPLIQPANKIAPDDLALLCSAFCPMG